MPRTWRLPSTSAPSSSPTITGLPTPQRCRCRCCDSASSRRSHVYPGDSSRKRPSLRKGVPCGGDSTARRSIPAVMLPELLGFLGRAVAVLDVQPHHPQLLAGVGRAGVVALARGVGPDLGGVAAPVGEDQLAEAERAGGRVGGSEGEAAFALDDPLLGLVQGGPPARTRALVAVIGNRG